MTPSPRKSTKNTTEPIVAAVAVATPKWSISLAGFALALGVVVGIASLLAAYHLEHPFVLSLTTSIGSFTSLTTDNDDSYKKNERQQAAVVSSSPWDLMATTDHSNEQEQDEICEVPKKPLRPYPVCGREHLSHFQHDRPVPGLHLLCFQRTRSTNTNYDEVDDDVVTMTAYKGATRVATHALALSLPMTWEQLQQLLYDELQVPQHNLQNYHRSGRQPWSLFSEVGEHIIAEHDTESDGSTSVVERLASDELGLALLLEGGQWVWPGVSLGYERTVDLYSVMPRDHVPQPLRLALNEQQQQRHRQVRLTTLSLRPLVLFVDGFLTDRECDAIRQRAAPTMRYSQVALMDHDAGRPATDFRTSQTTFLPSKQDGLLMDVDDRVASLVRMSKTHQEPVQVLRYETGERYTHHADFFDPNLYANDKDTIELIKDGARNRMVTVFWYLSDVAEGGETIFPRAFGKRELSQDDCETGLKVKPEKGKVILFYSMGANGQTDDMSIHGACPVKNGVKWAGNKWVWNEPMKYTPP
jgi:prolyl 4-hydroxylase